MVASLPLATIPGPDGPVHVALSARGVVALEHGGARDAFDARLAARFHGLAEPDAATRAAWARHRPTIQRLIDGEAIDVTRVPVDVADRSPWDQRVLAAVREVPWGETASYAEIARRIGAPRAARAVGGAVHRCPIGTLIPCHRIIASDGTLGGYGGDDDTDRGAALDHKRWLLLREGVTVASRVP